MYCTKCLDMAATQNDAEWEYCNGRCQTKLFDWHFVDHMLHDWKTRQSQLEIQCARCIVVQEIPASMQTCVRCHRETSMSDFSPYAAKDRLGQQLEKSRYHLMDCVLPECFRFKTRAPFPKNYVKVLGEVGEYHDYCQRCRASDLRVCSRCHPQK